MFSGRLYTETDTETGVGIFGGQRHNGQDKPLTYLMTFSIDKMAISKAIRFLNILKHWRLLGTTRLPYGPEQINIEVTNLCNFRCKFCAQSDPGHHQRIPTGFLTGDQLEVILAKLRRGGVQGSTLFWTLDGEPFLNKDFPKLCAIAIGYGFSKFVFATNFAVASLEKLAQLPREASYICAVDFCADQTYFEEVRGTRGSWKTIVGNIRALKDHKHNPIRIGLTDITSYQTDDEKTLIANRKSLATLFQDCDYVKVIGSRRYHNQAGFCGSVTSSRKMSYRRCAYPWHHLVIACNGDVVPCCRDTRRLSVLGNLLEQDLAEVWNGDKMVAFRKNLVDRHIRGNAACRDCDLPWSTRKTFSVRFLIGAAAKRLFNVAAR